MWYLSALAYYLLLFHMPFLIVNRLQLTHSFSTSLNCQERPLGLTSQSDMQVIQIEEELLVLWKTGSWSRCVLT